MNDESMGRKPGHKPGPATHNASTRGEFDFIERVRRQEMKRPGAHRNGSSLILGIGDDAAILRPRSNFDTLITTDLLVENIDFDLERFPVSPRALGHKALAVSLSDIAAMGARPRACLLSVGLPQARWDSSFLEELYRGLRALAARHEVLLVGGDISRTPERVVIDSIVLGDARRGRAVRRAGAQAGDIICVTGTLGGAAAGLRILMEAPPPTPANPSTLRARERLVERQIRPVPRVSWGHFLGERRLATAMLDVSDGLSSDLAHLCEESGVGARIEAARLPLDKSIERAGMSRAEALALALDGGEDFELLFTIQPRNLKKLPQEIEGVAVACIGEVTGARAGVTLVEPGGERALTPAGFEHFRRGRR